MRRAGRCAADPVEMARREAMVTLTEIGWGASNPAYRQLFTSHYVPDATPKQMGWFNEMQRLSASPDNAVRLQRRPVADRRRGELLAAGADADPDLPLARRPGGALLAGRGDGRGNPRRALRPAREPQPHPARGRAGVGDFRARESAAISSSASARAPTMETADADERPLSGRALSERCA